MRIIVFCAISGLGLLGCTAQGKAMQELQQKTKMESALTPYVGRSIADFMIDRGPSTSTIDLGPNKRAFQWKITGQTAGAVVPLSGMLVTVPPQQQTCTVSLIASTTKKSPAMSDWIIESWRWNGEC
jgi:hypothetical protein